MILDAFNGEAVEWSSDGLCVEHFNVINRGQDGRCRSQRKRLMSGFFRDLNGLELLMMICHRIINVCVANRVILYINVLYFLYFHEFDSGFLGH